MINKKIGIMTLGLALASLASCGSSKPTITFSAPGTDTAFMTKLAEEFKAANPDFAYDVVFGGEIPEGEVKTQVLKDVKGSPDVVLLADDNVRDMVDAEALVKWDAKEVEAMVKQSGEEAVTSMKINGETYGIPYRGDNGYQLIYDKNLLTEDDVKSLEGLLEKAQKIGKKVAYDIKDAWYTPAPFFANGVKIEYGADGKFVCDIASEKGKEVMRLYSDLWAKYGGTTWIDVADSKDFGPAAGDNQRCAQIVWNAYDQVKEMVEGGNVGVAQLPTVTLGGEAKQLVTYAGYKGVAVVAKDVNDTERIAAAKEFALFISNTANQEKRLKELNQGVTDLSIVAKTELWENNPFLISLAEQQKAGASVIQATHARQTWWDAGKILMENVTKQKAALTDDEIMLALQKCQTAVLAEAE